MFKVILVVYVMGVGTGKDYTNAGSTNVTLFETMEQCEAAIVHVKDVWDDWHYGDDKSKIVDVRNTAKCFDIPANTTRSYQPSPPATKPEVKPQPKSPPPVLKKHKRWDQ